MFASNKLLKYSILLILISALVCASHLQAQQDSDSRDSDSQDSNESRRIERLGESSTDDWEMDLRMPSAATPVSPGMNELALPDEEQNQQLQDLLSKLAANPGNRKVAAQLNALLADVLNQVNELMDAGSIDEAESLLPFIQSIDPGLAGLTDAKARLQSLKAADDMVKAGEKALLSGQVIAPDNSSALFFYSRALEVNPNSESARKGLEKVQSTLIERALDVARDMDFETAEAWLSEASKVSDDQKPIEDARFQVSEFKRERAIELEQKVMDAMSAGNFTLADFGIIDMMALGGYETKIQILLARLDEARFYGGFEPGQVITDGLQSGGKAPEIVIVDAGSFLMGSNGRSDKSSDHEEPQHRVIIKRGFGLGVREVTVEEFKLFVTRTGYRTAAEVSGSSSIYDEAAGRLSRRNGISWKHDYVGKKASLDMPVLHVNAYDAQAYVQWLGLETGKAYRLPSEAEYEYVARAGNNGAYWWGDDSPSEVVENLTGERDKSASKRQWSTYFKKYGDGHWGPAPAGSLRSEVLMHPMGVYDIAGNVSEWMADCWHENYVQAPTDGSAWFNPGCKRRVVRGGYWASAPEQGRAAYRFPVSADSHGPVIGFRVARDL
ncbi:MAG: formylglycine-generating enzyme family protein [Lysobacterales bacterium]